MTKPLGEAKEPLMISPTGIGYMGVLMYDNVEDKVQCSECGEWFDSVGAHLRGGKTHGINAKQYKDKHSLMEGTALTTPSMSERGSIRSEFMYRLNHENMSPEEIYAEVMEMSAKSVKMRKENRYKQRHSIEMMNKFGTCPKQIEEKFIRAIESIGHTPSWDELYRYDPNLLQTLYKRFKGYSNALQYFGLKGKRRVSLAKYTRENVELVLCKFIDQYHRLPNPKDTKIGLLPDYMTVARNFPGGWIEAKKFCFEYLKKNYPKDAEVYDDKLRRIIIRTMPSMGSKKVGQKGVLDKRVPKLFPPGAYERW